VTGLVSGYAPRNPKAGDSPPFAQRDAAAFGIRFAFATGMKMLLASIALSALVLWALSCGGIRA
jgi:hypothetical protein